MKILASLLALTILATPVLPAQEKQEKAEQSDQAKLKGIWQMVSGERGGSKLPDPERYSLIINDDTIILMRDGEVGFRGKLKLDATKTPKTLDMVLSEDSQGHKKGEVSLGIYSLEGDKLKWCNSKPGSEKRPAKFASEEGEDFMMVLLERTEAKKKE